MTKHITSSVKGFKIICVHSPEHWKLLLWSEFSVQVNDGFNQEVQQNQVHKDGF